MKTAEEWHHTEKYIKAQREGNPRWTCKCMACENVRAIQADARAELEFLKAANAQLQLVATEALHCPLEHFHNFQSCSCAEQLKKSLDPDCGKTKP